MIRQDIIDTFMDNQGCCFGLTNDNTFELFNIANRITVEYYNFLAGVQLFVRTVAQMPGGNYAKVIKVFNINDDDFAAIYHIAGTSKANSPILSNSIVACGERILETILFPEYNYNEHRYGAEILFKDQMMEKSIKEQYRQLFLVNMVAEDLKEVTIYSDQLFSMIMMLCKRIIRAYLNIVYTVDNVVVPDVQEKIFSYCLPLHFRVFNLCSAWSKPFN